MFQSTLAFLKLRLGSLRSSKKQKRKSTAPVQSTSNVLAEKAPGVAPAQVEVLPPPATNVPEVRYERKMGDSELSYYLPSRANGVNDMCAALAFFSAFLSLPTTSRYLHLGFKAPNHVMERERVRVVWAILRQRHPLLAATVEMHDYGDVRFV